MSIIISALIDSGAEGNFIHSCLVDQLQSLVEILKTSLRVAALDGGTVGAGTMSAMTEPVCLETSTLHSELIPFLVLEHSEFELVLDLPWLEKHNPSISWFKHEILKWLDFCLRPCITTPSVSARSTMTLPLSIPTSKRS